VTEQRHTIFIIDDSEDEIHLTGRIVSRIFPDIRLEWAMSGEEGLALLRNSWIPPLITLLDLKMTGIDGIETLRRIRADKQLKDLYVAVVTNSNLKADHARAMAAGANVVLHKDVDMDRFRVDLTREMQERIHLQM
jgi:two-component system response regulator CpxR